MTANEMETPERSPLTHDRHFRSRRSAARPLRADPGVLRQVIAGTIQPAAFSRRSPVRTKPRESPPPLSVCAHTTRIDRSERGLVMQRI